MTMSAGPYLELKSERVQRELARLSGWDAAPEGLEGRFQFQEGTHALLFLRRLGSLLAGERALPRKVVLQGAVLYVSLGEEERGVLERDLALAARISELDVVTRLTLEREGRASWA